MRRPTIIKISNVNNLEIKHSEVKRYLGIYGVEAQVDELICTLEREVLEISMPIASYIKTTVCINEDVIDFEFEKVQSLNLAKNLRDCNEAFVFASTLGVEVDRLIEKYMKTEPSKGVIVSSIASALIESFCDYVNSMLVCECKSCPRFSPGYGDFSIEHQEKILKALEANKLLGISLTDSYMMKPSKSVTAIIGIKKSENKK